MSLYDTDFHAWAHQQASLARARTGDALDWDNVAEELESLGKQQRSELRSRYEVLITHLLKWMYRPERRGRNWTNTVKEQRLRIARHLSDNPSLRASDAEVFADAYDGARLAASSETDLDEAVFPAASPFTPEQARDGAFWPDLDRRLD